MIKVAYTKKGAVRELICAGHAEYGGGKAPREAGDPSPCGLGMTDAHAGGGDIVCAAASALTGTLVAVLLKHDEEFFSLSIGEGDGECRVTCAGDAAEPYFEFALVGLKKLAEAFPGCVEVRGYAESGVSD